jgi:flagellar motor switch protein FliM
MLTQAEIDALLTGTIELEQPDSKGSVNLADLIGQTTQAPAKDKESGREIRPYNFWSPDRFSKEQMRAVELVHDDLAERLTNSLPTYLRTGLRPRVVHTEQGRFHDFLKDLPGSSLFHMINLAPLPGQIVLTISPDVSYVILEQRLGGSNDSDQHRTRELTEIDQALLRGMVEHMLNDIKAAWSTVVAIEPNLEDSTANQHWVQMVMGNERMMLITFELTIQGVAGTMNIYIPFTMLKPIANVLNPHIWITGRKENKPDPDARQRTYDGLSQVTLGLRVYLGTANLKMSELVALKTGDIIRLDTPVNQDLQVEVADRARFYARVGKVGNRIAAQITNISSSPLPLNG